MASDAVFFFMVISFQGLKPLVFIAIYGASELVP
jgi:hypothetical protein